MVYHALLSASWLSRGGVADGSYLSAYVVGESCVFAPAALFLQAANGLGAHIRVPPQWLVFWIESLVWIAYGLILGAWIDRDGLRRLRDDLRSLGSAFLPASNPRT
jgi:hypothetical protein